jgi:hypothetical protein
MTGFAGDMKKKTENSVRHQWQFQPGQSGNPAGKPKGTRNKTTLALEALFDGEAEALTRKAIELAKTGDIPALRRCLDRILPPRKDRPISFEMPKVEGAKDAAAAISAVLGAVSAGEITPSDAGEITKLLDAYVRAFETAELAERVERLEKATKR